MSDNQQKQLFTELTPEQAATVEGGAAVSNTTDDTVNISWKYKGGTWNQKALASGETWTPAPSGTYASYTLYYDHLPGEGDDYIWTDLVDSSSYTLTKTTDNDYQIYETGNIPPANPVPN